MVVDVTTTNPAAPRRHGGVESPHEDGVTGRLAFEQLSLDSPHAATSSSHTEENLQQRHRLIVERMFRKNHNISTTTLSQLPSIHQHHVTLTTFWGLKASKGAGANASFYHGRAVPSFDWVVVFLASWMERVCHVGSGGSGGGGDGNHSSAYPYELSLSSQLVFFCDAQSAASILLRLMTVREGQHLRNMRRCSGACGGTITFVVVRDPALDGRDYASIKDRLLEGARGSSVSASLIQEVLGHHILVVNRAAYMGEAWVTSVPNGANNFRFAFYRDWLHRWFVDHTRNDGRGIAGRPNVSHVLRVLIADNTDVAFQRNPFDVSSSAPPNQCFPPVRTANHQKEVGNDEEEQPWVTFTLEDASKTFKNEKYNRRWVGCYQQAGEPNVLKKMEATRQRVSCAGVTLGNGYGALQYCKAQLRELTRAPLIECAMSTIKATLDQATHNVLLHRWLQWSTAAYEAERKQLDSSMEPLSPYRRHFGGSGQLLNRWTALKLSNRNGLGLANNLLGAPPNGFYVFTAAAEMSDDVVASSKNSNIGQQQGSSSWVPCVFHGNFGKPNFMTSTPLLQDQGLRAQPSTSGGGGGGQSPPLFALVHQYTSNRVPAMMDLMRRLYLL
ncbi:Hypothetical protein, putative [Bodo saltans]|uniref:Uncharacterized protein n=1 Tax=Bodo saltans TaxID=75058 RepID=A0A0S4JJH9_BODSA|nr:Hypothetical protein, putative [Bodo saltans]|eukprot:CUG90081.1 Hypothetical protein, putative [Bodo saltans]